MKSKNLLPFSIMSLILSGCIAPQGVAPSVCGGGLPQSVSETHTKTIVTLPPSYSTVALAPPSLVQSPPVIQQPVMMQPVQASPCGNYQMQAAPCQTYQAASPCQNYPAQAMPCQQAPQQATYCPPQYQAPRPIQTNPCDQSLQAHDPCH
jgi:hypothetical protein